MIQTSRCQTVDPPNWEEGSPLNSEGMFALNFHIPLKSPLPNAAFHRPEKINLPTILNFPLGNLNLGFTKLSQGEAGQLQNLFLPRFGERATKSNLTLARQGW